jgi:hypothetical protein
MTSISPDHVLAPRQRGRLGARLSAQANHEQVVVPRTGMALPRQLSFEKWLGIGIQLAAVTTSSAWCLGDWLIYGQDSYSGRYREAIEQTSLEYQTLRNYAWVAGRFTLSRRRDGLSFAHHAEVARLPEHEQDFWLRKAEEASWSRNALRRELRASLAERTANEAADSARTGHEESVDLPIAEMPSPFRPDTLSERIQVELSPEQLESCRTAASRLGHGIEEWAAFALDQAAREQLNPKNCR